MVEGTGYNVCLSNHGDLRGNFFQTMRYSTGPFKLQTQRFFAFPDDDLFHKSFTNAIDDDNFLGSVFILQYIFMYYYYNTMYNL